MKYLITQSVIVRLGLFYVIQIGKFSHNHICYSSKLPRRIVINCGALVDFYKNDADENVGLDRKDGDTKEDSRDDDDNGYDDYDIDEIIIKANLVRKLGFNQIQM